MDHLLEVKDLSCSILKGHTILSHLSFVVDEGNIVVVQGKSGCGKSTLLKCLAHLNTYTGRVLYRGKWVQNILYAAFRRFM